MTAQMAMRLTLRSFKHKKSKVSIQLCVNVVILATTISAATCGYSNVILTTSYWLKSVLRVLNEIFRRVLKLQLVTQMPCNWPIRNDVTEM